MGPPFRDDSAVPYDGPERRTRQGGRRTGDLAPEQQAAIADALLSFGDLTAEEPDEVASLLHLIDCCRLLLSNCEYSVVMRGRDGEPRALAASSEAVRMVDEQQLHHRRGPTVEAFDHADSVLEMKFAESRELWPDFAASVRSLGFTRLYAIPLRPQFEIIGVLNVYARAPDEAPSIKMAWIRTLARGAAASLDNLRSSAQLNILAVQVQRALDTRVLVEEAKGVIATQLGVGLVEAFEILRRYARSHRRSIRDVTADVILHRLTGEQMWSAPMPNQGPTFPAAP